MKADRYHDYLMKNFGTGSPINDFQPGNWYLVKAETSERRRSIWQMQLNGYLIDIVESESGRSKVASLRKVSVPFCYRGKLPKKFMEEHPGPFYIYIKEPRNSSYYYYGDENRCIISDGAADLPFIHEVFYAEGLSLWDIVNGDADNYSKYFMFSGDDYIYSYDGDDAWVGGDITDEDDLVVVPLDGKVYALGDITECRQFLFPSRQDYVPALRAFISSDPFVSLDAVHAFQSLLQLEEDETEHAFSILYVIFREMRDRGAASPQLCSWFLEDLDTDGDWVIENFIIPHLLPLTLFDTNHIKTIVENSIRIWNCIHSFEGLDSNDMQDSVFGMEGRIRTLLADNETLKEKADRCERLEEICRTADEERLVLQMRLGSLEMQLKLDEEEADRLREKNRELTESCGILSTERKVIDSTVHRLESQVARLTVLLEEKRKAAPCGADEPQNMSELRRELRAEKRRSDAIERRVDAIDGGNAPVEEAPPVFREWSERAVFGGDGCELVRHLLHVLRDGYGRNVDEADVLNYMICLTQGFVTTFAGEPGTGKTSLCSILAGALGLIPEDSKDRRFIDISVERGWNSPKDFIGFWNPLSERMEKSNTEVYDAFDILDRENGEGGYPPFLMLLDEANLSSMEHYWSAFFRMCGTENYEERILSLGGERCFRVPSHLRFLATVNFDHTTEELSPRFLDRSWVVKLDAGQGSAPAPEDERKRMIDEIGGPVTMDMLEESFGRKPLPEGEVSDIWNSIRTAFREEGLPISQRNVLAVEGYAGAFSAMLPEGVTEVTGLDLAVAEKLLPLIDGPEARYGKLVGRLAEISAESGMTRTGKLIAEMKKKSTGTGYYQFFAR